MQAMRRALTTPELRHTTSSRDEFLAQRRRPITVSIFKTDFRRSREARFRSAMGSGEVRGGHNFSLPEPL